MFRLVLHYIYSKKIILISIFYFLFSSILKAFSTIDICIPCLWKLLFGIKCFGCGLTTAFIKIIQFDFFGAFESNWLIFIILPAGLIYFILEMKKLKLARISRINVGK
jgi:hypothetical protein